MAADCLFCRIASGEIPADTLHVDDAVIAFRDVNPQAPTHILVIPRAHIASAGDLRATDSDCSGGCSRSWRTWPTARGSSAAGALSRTWARTAARAWGTCTCTSSAGGA